MAEKLSKEGKLFESLLSVFKQWGLAVNQQTNVEEILLPISYSNAQFFAVAIDYGMEGKAYGVGNFDIKSFSVHAPTTPFSVFYLSIGR